MIKPLLQRFDKISVREELASEWIEELMGEKPTVTCDPTVLWEPSFWNKFVLDGYAPKGKYVLIYAVNPDKRNISDGIEYAKKKGIPAYFINFYTPIRGTKTIRPTNVKEWITLFAKADTIFSASYHGLLFSLYFKKNVFFYNRGEKSRMISLSKSLKIENREGNAENIEKDSPIDYAKGNIWITIYTTVATTVLSLIFVLLIPSHRALGKSLGAVVSSVLFAIGVWFFSFKRRYVKVKVEYWKYGLLISVPLILNSISLNILAQSDRIFITKFCGADFTGIYSLAYSYAILINIVLNAANEAWLPWFHDSLNDNLKDEIRKNVKPLIVFGCWFGVGCIAIAPEAIALLGGSAYMKGIWVVPPVTVGVVCSYIFQHYEHIELHLKKTWYISFGTIMAAGINIVLNYIFVQRYGFVAAAYTTLFCYFVLMILHHFISRYVLKLHLYDDKFMYLSVLVTCILGAIFMGLYNKPWILRWILISIISLGYLWINRKLFKSVISKFMSRKR